jgi:hypothetical protein
MKPPLLSRHPQLEVVHRLQSYHGVCLKGTRRRRGIVPLSVPPRLELDVFWYERLIGEKREFDGRFY